VISAGYREKVGFHGPFHPAGGTGVRDAGLFGWSKKDWNQKVKGHGFHPARDLLAAKKQNASQQKD